MKFHETIKNQEVLTDMWVINISLGKKFKWPEWWNAKIKLNKIKSNINSE